MVRVNSHTPGIQRPSPRMVPYGVPRTNGNASGSRGGHAAPPCLSVISRMLSEENTFLGATPTPSRVSTPGASPAMGDRDESEDAAAGLANTILPSLGHAAQTVDKLANNMGISQEGRQMLHHVAHMPTNEQMTVVCALLMQTIEKVEDVSSELKATASNVSAVQQLVRQNFKMNEAQMKNVRLSMRDHLVKALNSYGRAVNRAVEKYVSTNAAKLQLESYSNDKVIQSVVNKFIASYQTTTKSNIRKTVFKSITGDNPETLDAFATRMLKDYAKRSVEKEKTEAVVAQFALMRTVAYHIVQKNDHKRGADTGFWRDLDAQLAGLVAIYGKDRDTNGWHEWYVGITMEDENRHNQGYYNNLTFEATNEEAGDHDGEEPTEGEGRAEASQTIGEEQMPDDSEGTHAGMSSTDGLGNVPEEQPEDNMNTMV